MPAISLISLALALAPVPAGPAGPLPPSLNVAGIERCKPATIDAAVNCLTSNMDSDDQSDIARGGGAKYRPALFQLLGTTWHLDDPATPLVQEMTRRGIYYVDNAPGVLVSIMDQRIQGLRVDYKRMSNDLKKTAQTAPVAPPPPPPPTAPVAPPQRTSTIIAPGSEPSMAGAVAVPLDQCKRPNAVPGEIVLSCMKLPDGGLIARRQIPSPNPAKAPN